jgi:hypothetical protein
MSKHTPGPWKIIGLDSFSIVVDRPDHYPLLKEGRAIAHVQQRKNKRANACLIAAAPEMLEVIKAALRQIDYCVSLGILASESGLGGLRAHLLNIIKKSEGQS